MFFADLSVSCQPIFMKFCNNDISAEFHKIIDYIVFKKLDHFTCNKLNLRHPSISSL